jgi:hypothetical protein
VTWDDNHRAAIDVVHARLPADATLADRKRALAAIAPGSFSPSWSQKTWQAARRKYLARYGYVPRTKPKAPGQQEMFDRLPRDPATGRPVI